MQHRQPLIAHTDCWQSIVQQTDGQVIQVMFLTTTGADETLMLLTGHSDAADQ